MGVTNRVWDAHLTGTVHWDTEFPDETGQAYPGPGAFSQSSDFCVVRGKAVVTGSAASPDNIFSPVEQWLLNGHLSGTNNISHLSVGVGSEAYLPGPISGTLARSYVHDTRDDSESPVATALQITGNMSIQYWVKTASFLDTFGSKIIECSNNSSGGDANNEIIWNAEFRVATGRLRHGWESEVASFQFGDAVPDTTPNVWNHVVVARDVSGGDGASRIRVYINGEINLDETDWDSPGTTLTNPVAVRMGNSSTGNTQALSGCVHGMTIYDRTLTQAEAMALYKRGISEEDR